MKKVVPITLNKKWKKAAFLAEELVLRAERKAVMVVPILQPKI